MALSWFSRFASLVLWQLPILWLVLAISPNLNQWRALWVLVTNYFLLYGAIAGFEIVFQHGDERRNERRSLVWGTAAGLYVAAAVFSLVKVGLLYFMFLVLFGVLALGVYIFLQPRRVHRTMSNSFLLGIYSVVMIYAGINNSPLEITLKSSVLSVGVVVSLFYAAFLYAENYLNRNAVDKLVSWVLLILAISSAIAYFLVFLERDYLYILSVFFVVAIFIQIVLPSFRESRRNSFLQNQSVLLIAILLNGYFFYVFASYTHILQLVE